MKTLAVIPVHNEIRHIKAILAETRLFAEHVLVVDDGSDDGTGKILDRMEDILVLRHGVNRGYGRSLIDGFAYAVSHGYDAAVTLDADGQHEPQYIPWFLHELAEADIVSGSRYLVEFEDSSPAPLERRSVNRIITDRLRRDLGLRLSDAFCGFKAYRASALRRLRLTENGYGMPLELWVQAAVLNLRIKEIPIKRIYHDTDRSFGGKLDQTEVRLRYYNELMDRTLSTFQPEPAGMRACCCPGGCGGKG